MKRKISLVIFLVLALSFTGCFGGSALNKLTIEIKEATTEIGQGQSINLEVKGSTKKNKEAKVPNPEWSLSDKDQGKLEPTGAKAVFTAGEEATGTVDIIVKSGKIQQSVTITIKEVTSDLATETVRQEAIAGLLFRETFDNVSNGTNIRNDQSRLDNPNSFSRNNFSGTVRVNNGELELGSQRMAIAIPGLANASNPVLRVTIKNDNGSGKAVNNLKLAVGNKYTTSGSVGQDGYRAHGEHLITNSNYQVIDIPLNKEHTHTGIINFRGIVGTSSTAGLFIDQIEVLDTDSSGSSVDKNQLNQSISDAEYLLANTSVGVYKNQAPVHAHFALQNALNQGINVNNNDYASQGEVDAAVSALNVAIASFNSEIVTQDNPKSALTFTVEGNHSHFTTESNRGTLQFNSNPQFIKTGTESIQIAAIGQPYPLRVRVSHPNWINDWSQYDHLAAWFYIENVEALNRDTAVQISHPNDVPKTTLKRSAFVNGWNEIVVNLRDDLGLTENQLRNMKELFEFNIRFSGDYVPVYFDEIRLVQLSDAPIVIPVDKGQLTNTISDAKSLKNSVGQGSSPGQAPAGAHSALQNAINTAEAVYNNQDATQVAVDQQVTALLAAMQAFNAAIIEDSGAGDGLIFRETFDGVNNGTNIRNDQSRLDNPNSFSKNNMSGTIRVNSGVAELGSQRFTITVPGLASANYPVLRVTIKNDNGSGKTVSNLKLAVGNKHTTSGSVGQDGYRAHGEHSVNSSSFHVLEVPLNREHLHTGMISFRGIVGGSGTAGLFIDKIEVWETDGSGYPVDPDPDPDPVDPDPDPGHPGEPGTPPNVIDDAYFGLVGWASLNGGTTGGEGGEVIYVKNGRELYDALYANERRHKGDSRYGAPYPLTIYVTGKITPSNTGESKIDIKDQADVSIIGVGNQADFDDIGITIRRSSNIIIRNITVHNVTTGDKKAIDVTTDSRNIWIDRCTFYSDRDHHKDYYDGLVDIKESAEYVTISWCKFYDHWKTSLVGHTDTASRAPDKVTYHHNHFYNLNSRVPLIRYATVHLFNNYFHNIDGSGINCRNGAQVKIENNYFDNVGSGTVDSHAKQVQGPIGWWYGSSQTGYWEVSGNKFVNCPVSNYSSTTTVNIPYDYSMALNSADRARELVIKYAGAGSPSL